MVKHSLSCCVSVPVEVPLEARTQNQLRATLGADHKRTPKQPKATKATFQSMHFSSAHASHRFYVAIVRRCSAQTLKEMDGRCEPKPVLGNRHVSKRFGIW